MPLIIAAAWAALIPVLRAWLPSLIGRVLLAFGIGLASYTVGLPALVELIADRVLDLPDFWVQMFATLYVDVAFTMIISAQLAVIASRVFLRKLG